MVREQKNERASAEKVLTREIEHILERNQEERFLRKLLTRALILEKLIKQCLSPGEIRGFYF